MLLGTSRRKSKNIRVLKKLYLTDPKIHTELNKLLKTADSLSITIPTDLLSSYLGKVISPFVLDT